MSARPILSPRPRGLRRSWTRDKAATCESIGAYLASHPLVDAEAWGVPIEAQQFKDRQGRLRRVEAAYANGRALSYSRTMSGNVMRCYRWSAS